MPGGGDSIVAALAQASEAMVITGADRVITFSNRQFTELTGYQPDEVVGHLPDFLSSGRHEEKFYADICVALVSEGRWSGTMWNRCKDGSVALHEVSVAAVTDDSGEITQFIAIFREAREADEEKAKASVAVHDPLTGLPNRTLFLDRLAQCCAQARRDGKMHAVLFIDIDNFKLCNDTLGHDAGDVVLTEVAARLGRCVRKTDTVARLGGDEFTVILSGVGRSEDVDRIAQKIRTSLSQPIAVQNRSVLTTASIGIALVPQDGTDMAALLKNADVAMYEAKKAGRNLCLFYRPEMNKDADHFLEMEQRLLAALQNGEFIVYYHPILDLRSRRVVGAEALLRWQTPEGLLSPEHFITVAEETGLIMPIGDLVIDTVVNDLIAWRQAGCPNWKISVNVSRRQFQDTSVFERARARITAAGVSSDVLEFEISESMLRDDSRQANILKHISEFAVGLSIDDFGTGYTSLRQLQRFPVSSLKIDRVFVRDIARNEEDAMLSKAIIAMARSLDIDIVVEGIETEEQLNFFLGVGGDFVQGYLFSSPLSAGEFMRFAHENELAEHPPA